MTGGDAFAIAKRALKWAKADVARREHLVITRTIDAVAKKRPSQKKTRNAETCRAEHRKLAARAAGFRRGLAAECARVLSKGVD